MFPPKDMSARPAGKEAETSVFAAWQQMPGHMGQPAETLETDERMKE